MSLMAEIFVRGWDNFAARPGGMFGFRFFVQPAVAAMIAIKAGLNDARVGRPAYFWTAFADPAYRTEFLEGGWKDMRTPLFVSAALDAIYQVFEQQGIYFLEMVFTAIVLAVVPYVLLRAPASRVTQVFHRATKIGGPKTK